MQRAISTFFIHFIALHEKAGTHLFGGNPRHSFTNGRRGFLCLKSEEACPSAHFPLPCGRGPLELSALGDAIILVAGWICGPK